MTDGSISPGNRGFKEIREWIDENGREVGSEVNDVGEILNRAEKLADEKRDKEKGESKWKQQPMNGDIVEPLGEKLASSSGLPLDVALDQLESAERIAENEAVERVISSKRIVGDGWKKGFLNKPPNTPPHETSKKQTPLQEVKEKKEKTACQNDDAVVGSKNDVISDSELKSCKSDEPTMLGEPKKQQKLPMGDRDCQNVSPPARISRFKAERMKNRK